MTLTCSREREILHLLRIGHWPRACAPELYAHVQSCLPCRDVIAVAQAFQQANAETAPATPLQAAGVLWWRAQLRRRHTALARIAKPITVAQIFALSINVLVAIAFVSSQARHGLRWMSRLAGVFEGQTFHLKTSLTDSPWAGAFIHAGWSSWSVMLALGTLAFCGAIVLYLATQRQ